MAMLCSVISGAFPYVLQPKTNADGNADVHVSSLFSFTDGDGIGSVSQATNLPTYLTSGELKHSQDAITYTDYTNKGAYIHLGRSADVSGNPASGITNNVVRTSTFDITDNTKNDALFSYIPAPTISRWLESSNGGNIPANTLDATASGDSPTAPTARHFFVKVVDAHNPDNWLRLNYIYRRVGDARYEYGALSLSAPNGTGEKKLRIQDGGAVGENVMPENTDEKQLENVVDLQNAVKTQDNVWLKYRDLNSIYYDHAEQAIYAEVKLSDQEKVVKKPIRYLNYAGYSDGYTFDFSEVYLEFYYFAENNANCDENSYIVSNLDGMNLATGETGMITDVADARQHYGVTKLEESISSVNVEYALPMVKAYNIFGEKDANAETSNAQYTVAVYDRRGEDVTATQVTGLEGGKWTANAKIRFDGAGTYKIVYSTADEVVRVINLNILGNKIYSNDLFTAENITLTKNAYAPEYMLDGADAASECSIAGLGMQWTEAGTLTINREFSADVFKLGQSIVEFRVTPKKPTDDPNTQGTKSTAYEFENIVVSLVDAEDPSVYVNFVSHATIHGAYRSFTSVQASNQQYANDKKAKSKPNDTFGTYTGTNGVGIDSTFTGLPKQNTKSYWTTKFYYDNVTKQTAVAPAIIENINDIPGLAPKAYMFRDLDNPAHMIGDDKLFGGFPSGRVKIKISVSKALWDDANVILYSVMGNNVAGDVIDDSLAPEIVDANDFLTVEPKAELNKVFPLPVATAQDVMDGDLTRSIWATITDPDSETQNWNEDSFIPTKTGKYVYTVYAGDNAGNISKKTFPIQVYNKLNTVSLTFTDATGKSWTYPERVNVGQTLDVPNVTAVGGSGEKEVRFELIAPNGSVVDTSKNTMLFQQQGVYVARYEVTDYCGDVTSMEYYILVKRSQTPLLEDVMMPYAFLAGKSYTLPQGKAWDYYSYVGESRAVETKIEVRENDGEFVALGSDRKYTISDTAATEDENGTLTIRYTATSLSNATQIATKTYEVPILKTKYQGDYFIKSAKMDMEYVEVEEGYREAVFSTNTVGASLSYVNALPAQMLSMTLMSLKATELNAVDIYLTDSVDPTQSVILNVMTVAGKTRFGINGGASEIVTGSLMANGQFKFSVKTNYVVYDAENAQIGVFTTTANGSPFNGFSSNKVYVKIVVKDIGDSGASFIIRDFCNQAMFERLRQDLMAPMIIPEKEIEKIHDIGSMVTLSRAEAIDVMDPNATVVLTVKDPTGAIVNGLSKVNCDVERKISLTQFGSYTLLYEAKDSSGNSVPNQYSLKVRDDVAPNLEIEGNVKAQYLAGEAFIMNNARGVDNVTPTADMKVFVSIQEHYTHKVTTYPCEQYGKTDENDNKIEFIFAAVGTYTVKYYVRDTFSNITVKTFTVTVTEGGANV